MYVTKTHMLIQSMSIFINADLFKSKQTRSELFSLWEKKIQTQGLATVCAIDLKTFIIKSYLLVINTLVFSFVFIAIFFKVAIH